MSEATKRCRNCGAEKPIGEFYRYRRTRPNGTQHTLYKRDCKTCCIALKRVSGKQKYAPPDPQEQAALKLVDLRDEEMRLARRMMSSAQLADVEARVKHHARRVAEEQRFFGCDDQGVE